MVDSIIEVRDEEINVEKIMEKIRENIRRKKESSIFSPHSGILNQSDNYDHTVGFDINLLRSLSDVNSSSYIINTHRGFIGSLLVKGRHLVNEEIKRYVVPLLAQQSKWNNIATQLLHHHGDLISEIKLKISELETRLCEDNNAFSKLETTKISNKSENEIEIFRPLALKINYLSFEDQFRGQREDIKKRQAEFISLFDGCVNVLDIGCGRGEFLELMREKNIGAIGLDNDANMVNLCKSQLLDVILSDALTFLEKLEDESLDGIFIDQVVEHLNPEYFIKLLELCAKKLMTGSYIIAETINPLSLVSLMNFYIDLSHVKPIHPETMHYLFNVVGFREIDIRYLSLVNESDKLKILPLIEGNFGIGDDNLKILNNNFEIINEKIFGPQDYAIIGKK